VNKGVEEQTKTAKKFLFGEWVVLKFSRTKKTKKEGRGE